MYRRTALIPFHRIPQNTAPDESRYKQVEGSTCETDLLRSSAMACMVPNKGCIPGKICLKSRPLGPFGKMPASALYLPVSIPSPCTIQTVKALTAADHMINLQLSRVNQGDKAWHVRARFDSCCYKKLKRRAPEVNMRSAQSPEPGRHP